jgi:hypothetical protein
MTIFIMGKESERALFVTVFQYTPSSCRDSNSRSPRYQAQMPNTPALRVNMSRLSQVNQHWTVFKDRHSKKTSKDVSHVTKLSCDSTSKQTANDSRSIHIDTILSGFLEFTNARHTVSVARTIWLL